MTERDYFKIRKSNLTFTKGETISLAAFLVSLSAIIFNVYQFKAISERNNNHDKLTVRPILDYEFQEHDSLMYLTLTNKGFGPAIIQSYRVQYDDREFKYIWGALMRYDSVKARARRFYAFTFDSGYVFAPNESKDLARVPRKDFGSLRNHSLKIKIKYTDIYKDTFSLESR
jgi:hypothetical protein